VVSQPKELPRQEHTDWLVNNLSVVIFTPQKIDKCFNETKSAGSHYR
jgi:hypothetical protein